MTTYRAAIVGLGRMGSTICEEVVGYPAFVLPYSITGACRASERLELAAGSDIDPAKCEAFRERWGVEALYGDYLEMIEREKPDFVAICTKGDLHAEMMAMNRFEDLRMGMSPRDLTLYTSVESCPMCTVRLIGGGIGKVLHLADDLETGMTRRLGDLPPRWVELADEVVFSKADCSAALIDAAWRIFLINIDELFELMKNL